MIPDGGVLIDTPGIKELGLWADPDSLAAGFPEIEAYAADCRYRDCRHDDGPGCAVRAAVARGDIPLERFTAYRKLQNELAALEIRLNQRENKRRQKLFGRMVKEVKKMKKRERGH